MNSNQDRIFEWYDFLKHDLKPDKVNINYIRPPSARPKELIIDKARYDALVAHDQRGFAARRHQEQLRRRCRILQSRDRRLHARADREDRSRRPAAASMLGRDAPAPSSTTKARSRAARSSKASAIFANYDWDFSRTLVFARRWRRGATQSPTAASARTKATATTRRFPSIPQHLIEIKKLEHEMKEAASSPSEWLKG